MAYEESTYQKFSTENIFSGMIDMDGNIYNASMRSNRTKIGIDAEREQELLNQISEQEEIIKNYYDKLIELGVIVPPKTTEELAAEQLKITQEQAEQQALINQSLLEAISSLQSELKEMKTHGNGRNNIESSFKPDEQDSANDRKKSATGKSSNRTRKEPASTGNE